MISGFIMKISDVFMIFLNGLEKQKFYEIYENKVKATLSSTPDVQDISFLTNKVFIRPDKRVPKFQNSN